MRSAAQRHTSSKYVGTTPDTSPSCNFTRATEVKAKYTDRDGLRKELTTFKEKWPETRQRLEKQIISVEETMRRLRLVGAPTVPEDIGLSRQSMRENVLLAQKIRRRYTILDQALRMCKLDEWTATLFGKGGMWEMNYL